MKKIKSIKNKTVNLADQRGPFKSVRNRVGKYFQFDFPKSVVKKKISSGISINRWNWQIIWRVQFGDGTTKYVLCIQC